jgi:hypothetical protein
VIAVEIVLLILGSIVGLAAGIWIGLKWGMALSGGSSAKYWMANAVMVFTGLVIVVAGGIFVGTWFAVIGVGIMAGGFTGLKYGYGSSPGVWAVHDRLMGIAGPDRDKDETDATRRES